MPFDLFGDSFDQQFADPRRDESTLGSMMEQSLGGLAYVGKVLDKTFGGRAVRGVLGGNLDQALSVLPFSDTLGITDPNRDVQMRTLLDNFGVTTPGDDGFQNTVADLGASIALDPGTWFGAAVPKAVFRGLNTAGRGAGALSEAVTLGRINPYTAASGFLGAAKAPARALFDSSVGGAWQPKVQNLAADVFTPSLQKGNYSAELNAAGSNINLARLLEQNPTANPQVVRTAMTQAAEGFDQSAAQTLQNIGYGPQGVADILGLGQELGGRARATQAAETSQGLASKNLLDLSDWQLAKNADIEAQNRFVQQQTAAAAAQGLPQPPLMGIQDIPFKPQAQYVPRTLNTFDDTMGRRVGQSLGGASEFQIGREDILRGIPGGTAQINEWAMNPALTGTARTLDDTAAAQQIASHILGTPVGQIPLNHPVYGQAKSLADYLKSQPEGVLQKGLFNMDLVGNVKHRELDASRVIASGKTAMEGIGRGFAKPVNELTATGQPFVRLPEFLDAMRLSATDDQGFKIAHAEAARMLGLPPGDLEKLKDFAIPMDVAQDLGRIGKAWSTPASLAPVIQVWDNTVNWFKRNLTVPFPGFHVRNLMSGIFNMWRDGGGASGAVSREAGDTVLGMLRGKTIPTEIAQRLYPGASAGEATDQLLKEFIAGRVAFSKGGQAAERVNQGVGRGIMAEEIPSFAGEARPVSQDFGGFLNTLKPKSGERSYNPFNTETFVPAIAGEKVGNAVEDWIRGTHYLSKRLAGADPETALQSVMKYQIDYAKATEFEKNVMKRVFPWYSFSRNNLPPILSDLAEKPAKLLATARATTGTRERGEFVPPYIAEGASAPLPGAPEGQKRFISSFGLPLEDELVKTIGSALHGDVSRVAQQGFGMAIPFAKLPAELATGTQMYSGRKFEDLKPYDLFGLGSILPENRARQVSQIIANTPASRLASTIDKFGDERKGFGPTALNALTGARITDIDTEKAKAAASMELLKELLRGQPGVRVHEDVYIPKEKQAGLPADELYQLGLLKEIEKRATENARRQRVGQQ